MGFGQGNFAKVWKVEDGKGNYLVAEMSTSKKNKQTDKYETDWSNKFVRLVGTAKDQAKSFKEKETVKIGRCDVTANYDAEKKITYTNYVIFNFEDVNSNGGGSTKPETTQPTTLLDDDLPF